MGQYLPLVVMFVLAVVFGGVSFLAARLLTPPRPTAPKIAPYECGVTGGTEPPERFPVQFYLVAMIFIVLDIEIIFLYPYALLQKELGLFGFIDVALFAVPVFAAFVYLLSKGGLDWGPVKQRRISIAAVDPNRTATTTIRKVGLEGRSTAALSAHSVGTHDDPHGDTSAHSAKGSAA